MNMAENDITGVGSHRGYIMSHRGSIRSHLGYIISQGGPPSRQVTFKKKRVKCYMCFTDESCAGWTRTHARAPRRRLFNVKHSEMKTSNSKTTIKAIEKFREFHTSHAECPLLIRPRRRWGGGDCIYKE